MKGFARIKVERIGHIVFQVTNRGVNRRFRMLVPLGGPHNNQIIGKLADYGNDLVGVCLDGRHLYKSTKIITLRIVAF